MGFFRRVKHADHAAVGAAAIDGFWAWWAESGADAVAAALADRDPHRIVDDLAARVSAISAELSWELAKGRVSEHALIVTAEGNPERRAVARRWRMAAPAADASWEYSDFRQPAADPADVVLRLDGHQIEAAAVLVATETTASTVHVRLYHPSFPELPADARDQVAYLMLDAALGESAVDTWVGEITVAETAPPAAIPLADLPVLVRELAARNTGDDGEPHWVVLHGEDEDGTPVLASAQIPLRSASAPHLDTYVAVVVPFEDHTEQGFPGPDSLQPLRDFEDHLQSRLGGSGRVVAHQSRAGVRVLHVYVDGTTPAIEQLRAAVRGWNQGAVEIRPLPDPGWEAVAHLRGS